MRSTHEEKEQSQQQHQREWGEGGGGMARVKKMLSYLERREKMPTVTQDIFVVDFLNGNK